jgi:hypothetical protein
VARKAEIYYKVGHFEETELIASPREGGGVITE